MAEDELYTCNVCFKLVPLEDLMFCWDDEVHACIRCALMKHRECCLTTAIEKISLALKDIERLDKLNNALLAINLKPQQPCTQLLQSFEELAGKTEQERLKLELHSLQYRITKFANQFQETIKHTGSGGNHEHQRGLPAPPPASGDGRLELKRVKCSFACCEVKQLFLRVVADSKGFHSLSHDLISMFQAKLKLFDDCHWFVMSCDQGDITKCALRAELFPSWTICVCCVPQSRRATVDARTQALLPSFLREMAEKTRAGDRPAQAISDEANARFTGDWRCVIGRQCEVFVEATCEICMETRVTLRNRDYVLYKLSDHELTLKEPFHES